MKLKSNFIHFVTFQVLTAASMKMAVVWVVAPLSGISLPTFQSACCLHHQGDEYFGKLPPHFTAQHPRRQSSSRIISLNSINQFIGSEELTEMHNLLLLL
jgi:hypothetical protein